MEKMLDVTLVDERTTDKRRNVKTELEFWKQNLQLHTWSHFHLAFFFPRIWAPRTSFKAVLMAVDMKKSLQTSVKHVACRMVM